MLSRFRNWLISPTLLSFFRETYQPQRLLGKSHKTTLAYEVTIRLFTKHLGRDAKLKDLTDAKVAKFIAARIEGDKVAKGTAKRDQDQLLALWRYARDLGLLKRGPTLQALDVPFPNPRAYTREELDKLWAAIQREERPVLVASEPVSIYVPGPVYWSAVFDVFWDSAARFNEVFSLNEIDLDLERGFVTIRAENTKGRKAPRTYRLSDRAVANVKILLTYYPKRAPNFRVFRFATNMGILHSRLGDIIEAAGIEKIERKRFHMFRRSRLTYERVAGGDATKLAGHSNPAITERNYIDRKIVAENLPVPQIFRPGEAG